MEVKNRSELLFIYDATDVNPNGDPDENKPRIDEVTGQNLVNPPRLKRTIRDYLARFRSDDIWMIEETMSDGRRKTREHKLDELYKEQNIKNKEEMTKKLLSQFIDLRTFGATIAGEKKETKGENVFAWTGPVQFLLGRSLHKVDDPFLLKGTCVLPTKEIKSSGGAFTETWRLHYSLICFYGIINENAAKFTGLSDEDIHKMRDGMWNGTKNIITGSKAGQMPRLLIQVVYNEENYHIGDLKMGITLLDDEGKKVDKEGRDGKSIRSISEVKIDLTGLINTLRQNTDKIKEIGMEINSWVVSVVDGNEYNGKALVEAINQLPELKDKVKALNIDR